MYLIAVFISVFLLWSKPIVAVDLEQTDELIYQWLEIERQTSMLESDWQLQKPYLKQRISLLKAEKKQLQKILETSKDGQGSVDKQRSILLVEQTEMEVQQSKLKSYLDLLSNKIQTISVLIPPPLQAPWQKEQAILGKSPDTAVALQVALSQLAMLADFNQRISVHETLVKAPDGDEVLVKQLYLGVGAAWFSNKDGSYGGWGRVTYEGWVWQFNSQQDNQEIVKAIEIFEKQRDADFVHLQVQLNSTNENKLEKKL